jgi:RNA polymerase sigma-70 factor, ECF subfamily
MTAFEQARDPRAELDSTWAGHITSLAGGDQQALAAFYDATNRLVYSMALRILGSPADAEEVTLDTYTQVWRTAPGFDPQRGSVLAWLTMLTRSRAIDRLRGMASRARQEPPGELTSQGSADPYVARAVQDALNALAPEQREVIELAYWYGYSHSELAERLGQPLGTIKTRIRLGMLKLRAQLGDS